MTSVLQAWVMDLPLREQGTLLTAVRGCDEVAKVPLDSTARHLTAYLRYAFLNPADPREVDYAPGAFFLSRPPRDWKASELGHYPLHWVSHLMHAAEVIGYRHPDPLIAGHCRAIYMTLVHSLHLAPESKDEMVKRLGEDRVVTGTVVS